MRETLYNIKKNIIKIWKMYFTTEGTYTCILPDKIYLKMLYKKRTGGTLNLRNPVTYNDKLNWLKLYDRKPEYTRMVDKFEVRSYVKEIIGEEYLIPLIGTWEKVEEIPFEKLPNKFVLKCNHDNGVYICDNKEAFDENDAKKFLKEHLNRDYYKKAREWPYKNVIRKIVAEEYMEDKVFNELRDYKFFCFDGEVKVCCIISRKEKTIDYYDINFEHLDITDKWPTSNYKNEKPENFNEMVQIAEKLSRNIRHNRIDLYNINGRVYFGEITFFDDAGLGRKKPDKWNYIFGDWIKI